MKTKDTEYLSFGISALYKEVLHAQTATEVNFGIFLICFLLELFSVGNYWMPSYSGDNA